MRALLAAGKVAAGAWHTVRVDIHGPEAAVTYDGARLFSVRDESLRETGRIGLWSKADSVTEFESPLYGGTP